MADVRQHGGVDAQQLGQPLAVALAAPVVLVGEERGLDDVVEARVGVSARLKPVPAPSVLFVGVPWGTRLEAAAADAVVGEQRLELGATLVLVGLSAGRAREPIEAAARLRRRERHAEAEPVLHGAVEVDHPAQLVGDLQVAVLLVELVGRRRLRIGARRRAARGPAPPSTSMRSSPASAMRTKRSGRRRRRRLRPRLVLRGRRGQDDEGDRGGDGGPREGRCRLVAEVERSGLLDELGRADGAHRGLERGARRVLAPAAPSARQCARQKVATACARAPAAAPDRHDEDHVGAGRLRRLVGLVGRLIGVDDEAGAARAVAGHEAAPRGAFVGLDAAGPPDALPVVRALRTSTSARVASKLSIEQASG